MWITTSTVPINHEFYLQRQNRLDFMSKIIVYRTIIFSIYLISINNLICIRTLISSRTFIKIPMPIISTAVLNLFKGQTSLSIWDFHVEILSWAKDHSRGIKSPDGDPLSGNRTPSLRTPARCLTYKTFPICDNRYHFALIKKLEQKFETIQEAAIVAGCS